MPGEFDDSAGETGQRDAERIPPRRIEPSKSL